MPVLNPQEIPLDSPDSRYMFQPSEGKPFVATPAAIAMYQDQIRRCLEELQGRAMLANGLDYLQIFEDDRKAEPLWFIDDGEGGAITALLPTDY